MTFRRLTEQEKHEQQHRRIDETLATYNAVPKRRSGPNDYDRRKAGQQAWWALKGHLRAMHGWKGATLRKTYEDLALLHASLHELDTDDATE